MTPTATTALQTSLLLTPSVYRAVRALVTLLLAIAVSSASTVATEELRNILARRRARYEKNAAMTMTLLLNLSRAKVSSPVRHQIANARNPIDATLRLLNTDTLSNSDREKLEAILAELPI